MKHVRQDILEDYGLIDPKTKKPYEHNDYNKINSGMNEEWKQDIKHGESNWIRFRITFLSLLVSNSFLASYSMKGFYFLIIFAISSFVKPICMFSTFMGWLYEATHAMVFLKLIDAIYMGRHEKNLKYEEETWRML